MSSEPGALFSLPAIDDLASTEAGVILLGLDAKHLLAGLGLAALSDDPAAVTLLVDQVRHGGRVQLEASHLVAAGVHRWRAARGALAGTAPVSPMASPRDAWAAAYGALSDRQNGQAGPATISYLTACWLRAAEIDKHADADPEVPEVAP